jgi:ribonuclease HI
MSTYIYAVRDGFVPGVYQTWDEAKKQVDGYSGAQQQKFKQHQLQEAHDYAGVPLVPNSAPVITYKPNPSGLSVNLSGGSKSLKSKFIIKPVTVCRKKVSIHVERSLSQKEHRYFQHRDYDPVSYLETLHVYTDGSTINNGKKNATGGYGVFFGRTNIPYISQTITSGKITNNVAELYGIIEALKVIKTLNEKSIVIHYDSAYAEGVITGRKNASANLKLVHEGKDILRAVRQSNKVIKFEHVYSHNDDDDIHSIGNDIVDALAKRIPL